MARGDTARVRAIRETVDAEDETCHRLLAVLEPLAVAEASLFLGETERTPPPEEFSRASSSPLAQARAPRITRILSRIDGCDA